MEIYEAVNEGKKRDEKGILENLFIRHPLDGS